MSMAHYQIGQVSFDSVLVAEEFPASAPRLLRGKSLLKSELHGGILVTTPGRCDHFTAR